MSNNGTMSYIITMLRQINQTTSALSQNQTLLFEQFKTLDKKVDEKIDKLDKKFDELDKKFDSNYIKLDEKIDSNTASIIELQKTVLNMQKEIKDMHEDITTIYTLELDSRKKIEKII